MKKKIFLILITILTTCLLVFTMPACGGNNESVSQPHVHKYTILKSNETEHWYECSCGEKSATEIHKGGTASTTDKAKCSICNSEYGELEKAATVGLVFTLNEHNTEYTITGYTGNSADVYIPSLYKGKPVTRIEKSAFSSNVNLETIEFSNRMVSLGAYAFYNCPNLKSVIIPNSVRTLGESVFESCYSLTSATIGSGVEIISKYAFYECESLNSVIMLDGVKMIDDYAFENCKSLSKIEIPNSIKNIGEEAFYNCLSLEIIEIPNSVETIGGYAFYGCNNLTEITLPFIGYSNSSTGRNSVFGYIFGCKTSTSLDKISGATYQYYDSSRTAFFDFFCHYYIPTSLRKVKITSTNSINNLAFYNCSMLTSITIDDNVTNIGSYAFYNCSSLETLEISNSVTSINNHAFEYCDNLDIVYYEGTITAWDKITVSDYNAPLTSSTICFYVENEIDLPADDGNYWHYVDGVPTIWTKHKN